MCLKMIAYGLFDKVQSLQLTGKWKILFGHNRITHSTIQALNFVFRALKIIVNFVVRADLGISGKDGISWISS